jgi:hypothetical protein
VSALQHFHVSLGVFGITECLSAPAVTAFSLNAALALHQTDIFVSRTPTSGICRQSGTTTGYLFYLGNRRSMALRIFVQIMPVPT